jgi:hypothetical protein
MRIALCLALAAAFAGDAPRKPNVLFILCDDLRWDALSCAGHPHLKTPTLTASQPKACALRTRSAPRRSARPAALPS